MVSRRGLVKKYVSFCLKCFNYEFIIYYYLLFYTNIYFMNFDYYKVFYADNYCIISFYFYALQLLTFNLFNLFK